MKKLLLLNSSTVKNSVVYPIIMLEPLKTPCKQTSAPSPPPFQPAHGKISNFESINLLTMRPLTLIPKFDIIQAKLTYGLTQMPLIPMNPKLDLATVVSSTFLTNPN